MKAPISAIHIKEEAEHFEELSALFIGSFVTIILEQILRVQAVDNEEQEGLLTEIEAEAKFYMQERVQTNNYHPKNFELYKSNHTEVHFDRILDISSSLKGIFIPQFLIDIDEIEAVSFSKSKISHLQFIHACLNLKATVYGIPNVKSSI